MYKSLFLCTLNHGHVHAAFRMLIWSEGGTWPMFGYRGAAEGLKSWPCLGQEYAKNPTLCRTIASISQPLLGQVTKCTLAGFTWIYFPLPSNPLPLTLWPFAPYPLSQPVTLALDPLSLSLDPLTRVLATLQANVIAYYFVSCYAILILLVYIHCL